MIKESIIFLTSLPALIAQATEVQPQINAAYAFKDLTVSGLLLAGVIYLYRELARERKQREERDAARDMQLQSFVAAQTKAMTEAAEGQSAALGEVAAALGQLQEASRQQVTIYREHINKLVDAKVAAPTR